MLTLEINDIPNDFNEYNYDSTRNKTTNKNANSYYFSFLLNDYFLFYQNSVN